LWLEYFLADYLDVGDMEAIYQRCNAMVWYGERSQRYSAPTPDVSMCYMKGKITLPYMIEPPPLLHSLFGGVN